MATASHTPTVAELLDRHDVHFNLEAAPLVEHAIRRGEGRLAANGALVATTGKYTGRSPKDKFVVKDALTAGKVAWGTVNQPFDPGKFSALYVRVLEYFVAHDCGRVINPTIVDGQLHGGVAQGIGGTLLADSGLNFKTGRPWVDVRQYASLVVGPLSTGDWTAAFQAALDYVISKAAKKPVSYTFFTAQTESVGFQLQIAEAARLIERGAPSRFRIP